jgi:alpha-mannosidase
VYPDPDADQGEHVFHSLLVPGAEIADAVRAGYRTNLPSRSVRGSRDVAPIVRVSNPGVAIEAVKLAEDRSGEVIVRLYESLGRRANVTVTAGFPALSCTISDLLERPLEPAATGRSVQTPGPSVDLLLRPFELITLRFARG